jgi:geranylgeranyl diphosphate synthase type II
MNTHQKFCDFYDNWLSKRPFGPIFQNSLFYLLSNRGKLLRPNLILKVAEDLNVVTENHLLFALSLELHHNYTLIHDDLPCMDNDDIRRGKPTLHKVYGEAHALLAGDILLAKSFALLNDIHHPNLILLQKIYHYACGSKGLILGQNIDLEQIHQKLDPPSILRMFELKTGRLFQLALLGSYLLSEEASEIHIQKKLTRLGSVCGILFQLLDDYQDWHSDKKSDFNFFRANASEAEKVLKTYQEKFENLKNDLYGRYPNTLDYLSSFLTIS